MYKLYSTNTLTHNDKRDCVLFFANYIEDYESALNSKTVLESLAKNIIGNNSLVKINWGNIFHKYRYKI